MSRRGGIRRISFALSAVLGRYKENVCRWWRFADGIASSIHDHHNEFEVERQTNDSHLFQLDSCPQLMELKEFMSLLSIGDRIRVLCDDGVLVAEKISRTQFKLIDCQIASESVH